MDKLNLLVSAAVILIISTAGAATAEDSVVAIGSASYAIEGGYRSICTVGINLCSGWETRPANTYITMYPGASIHPFEGEWIYLEYLTNIYPTYELASVYVGDVEYIIYGYDPNSYKDPDRYKIQNAVDQSGGSSGILDTGYNSNYPVSTLPYDTDAWIYQDGNTKKSFYAKGWVWISGLPSDKGGYRVQALQQQSQFSNMISPGNWASVYITAETPFNEDNTIETRGHVLYGGS